MTQLFFDWMPPMVADIERARHKIRITALSMQVPMTKKTSGIAAFFSALETAALRGVDVAIALPAPARHHPATAFNAVTAERLATRRIRVKHIPATNLLHQKTCAIDDLVAWVGSGNFTQAAALHNFEAYIRAESPEIAAQLMRRFTDIAGG